MKRSELVGRAPGPATLVVLVGSFRSAAIWATGEGLHLTEWTLIESCSPLTIFDRRFTHPSKEDVRRTIPLASAGIKSQARRHVSQWWRPNRRAKAKNTPHVESRERSANFVEREADHGQG